MGVFLCRQIVYAYSFAYDTSHSRFIVHLFGLYEHFYTWSLLHINYELFFKGMGSAGIQTMRLFKWWSFRSKLKMKTKEKRSKKLNKRTKKCLNSFWFLFFIVICDKITLMHQVRLWKFKFRKEISKTSWISSAEVQSLVGNQLTQIAVLKKRLTTLDDHRPFN